MRGVCCTVSCNGSEKTAAPFTNGLQVFHLPFRFGVYTAYISRRESRFPAPPLIREKKPFFQIHPYGPLTARTAVGWMPDGRICLWCDKTSLTREQLQNKLLGLGVADALMLDGGGSIQGFFPSGKVASSRKGPTMVLFWEETKQERNADLNWAGKSGILTEVQLAEPEKVVTRRELAEILHRLQK